MGESLRRSRNIIYAVCFLFPFTVFLAQIFVRTDVMIMRRERSWQPCVDPYCFGCIFVCIVSLCRKHFVTRRAHCLPFGFSNHLVVFSTFILCLGYCKVKVNSFLLMLCSKK